MVSEISKVRFGFFPLLWFFLWTLLPVQTWGLPKTIGYLDSKDALVFEGNKTYTKDQICKALYSDKDVIVSISPRAPFENHLKMLQYKIQLGYLNGGFFNPDIRVSYVEQPEHILISIVEGPRYTKGPLVIHGASDELKNELTRCLNEIDPRVVEATGIPDIMKSIEKGDSSAGLTKDVYMAFLWGSSEPPSFAPSFAQTSSQYLNSLLKVLGYYNSEFTLKLVPDHSRQTAELHISFQHEGTRPHIGIIQLSGNTINSDEQVLNYLGLKTGQPLNDILVKTLERKLYDSGRFRFIEVIPAVNTADPLQSALNITLQETSPATVLDGKLTDKEALMQKVGQFMDRYQSWEKDIWFHLDFQEIEEFTKELQSRGIAAPVLEGVYSSQKGIILNEIINEKQTLNTFVLTPERFRYVCPPLNQDLIRSDLKGEGILQFNVAPDPQREDGWSTDIGISVHSDSTTNSWSWQPEIKIHPASWFHFANDPKGEITFIGDKRALVKNHGVEIEVNSQSGEVIEIRYGAISQIKFKEDQFDKYLKQLEKSIHRQKSTLTTTQSHVGVFLNIALPEYLTHLPNDRFTLGQKIQAVNAWRQIASGFAACSGPEDDTKDQPREIFPLPIEESLASGGMMPMLLSMIYQTCHDTLPRDCWLRTLSHVGVLMVSGHAQCQSVSEELKQLYDSDQIGPAGYLLTAQFLRQLGYPAYGAFAQRGLQVMSAEDFRKDWEPLLIQESPVKERLHCCLEQFQNCRDEDIQSAASIFPARVALLMEAAAQKIKETPTEQLQESLGPVLTDFWETFLKEQMRQRLSELVSGKAGPPKNI